MVKYRNKVDSELSHIKDFAANKVSPEVSMSLDFTEEGGTRSTMTRMTDALLNYKVNHEYLTYEQQLSNKHVI